MEIPGGRHTWSMQLDYDALIEEASRTMDPARRMALLHRAEDWILNREMIVLPLYYYVVQNLYDERDFAGLKPNLLNLIDLKAVVPLRGHRGRPRPRHAVRETGRMAEPAASAGNAPAPPGSAQAGPAAHGEAKQARLAAGPGRP